jgi:proteasome lid subunit RPN8/RPN11
MRSAISMRSFCIRASMQVDDPGQTRRPASAPAGTHGPACPSTTDRRMTYSHHRIVLDVRSDEGRSVGQLPIEPDWMPALECATFEGVRQGRLPALATIPSGVVEPLWSDTVGEPYVSAFRAVVADEGGELVSVHIPVGYVSALAERASRQFVEQGLLGAGQPFRYLVCAYPMAPESWTDAGNGMTAASGDPLPVSKTVLQPFLDASVHSGQEGQNDVPVFVPQDVIDDAFEMARGAGDTEAGGVLLGRLHFDSNQPEFFVELTALIPAPHGVSTATKFTFTPETWAAMNAAVRSRGRQESPLGWLHSHPDWCKACPPDKRRDCKRTNAFFSADDVLLHRTCFSRAFHTAMLISDSVASGLSVSFFGWRQGVVAARGFHILKALPGSQEHGQR